MSVSTVRGGLVSAARVLTDSVIAGHDGDEVTALAWLNLGEARQVCGLAVDADVPLDHPQLRRHLARTLHHLAPDVGSAGRVVRLLLCGEPPSLDAGEITDKGYVNQAVVLTRRAEVVGHWYADPAPPDVIASGSTQIAAMPKDS